MIAKQSNTCFFVVFRASNIHRDIKPANVMVKSNRRVKLGDVGLAVKLEREDKITNFSGTVCYAAPEDRKCYEASLVPDSIPLGYDHRSDWFSLGITALEFTSKYEPRDEIKMELLYANCDR